jgi:hypothetical protein
MSWAYSTMLSFKIGFPMFRFCISQNDWGMPHERFPILPISCLMLFDGQMLCT